MKLSSLFLLAGAECGIFAVLMTLAGSNDPSDARFRDGLALASITTIIIGSFLRWFFRKKEDAEKMLRRLEEFD